MRNPDDELRALERAAFPEGLGRPGGGAAAAIRLAFARNRRGLCACGAARQLVGIDPGLEGAAICVECTVAKEMTALEASTTTYTGYVSGDTGSAGAEQGRYILHHVRWITTYLGFPLAIVTFLEEIGGRRGTPAMGQGSAGTIWRARDRWAREWYGRNGGEGLVTGMRLRKTPFSHAEDPGVRLARAGDRNINLPGEEYEARYLPPEIEHGWWEHSPVARGLIILRNRQESWLDTAVNGVLPGFIPTGRFPMQPPGPAP